MGLAISLGELGEQSDTEKVFGDNGESVGVWQIHLPAHPDVTASCAADLDCSTRAAYRISNGGTNWNPWGAFTGGGYLSHQGYANKVVRALFGESSPNGTPSPAPTTVPTTTVDANPVIATQAPTDTSPVTGFQFPQLDIAPGIKLSSEPLFKVALTLIALGLIFFGILKLVGGVEAGPVRVKA
jgi:hypothetical protein